MNAAATIHASAVLVGARAILVRGPAGSGKSRLVLDLLQAAGRTLPFVRLVADDRVHVANAHGRLIARPAAALAGLLEIRGLGIRQLSYEPMAVIALAVDLDAPSAPRMPEKGTAHTLIEGVTLPRLAVARGCDPFPTVVAALTYTRPWTAAVGDAEPAGLDDRTLTAPAGRAGQG